MIASPTRFLAEYGRIADQRPGIALLSAVQIAYDLLPPSTELTARKRRVFHRVAAGDLPAAAHVALPDGFRIEDIGETRVLACGELSETLVEDAAHPERAIVVALLKLVARLPSES